MIIFSLSQFPGKPFDPRGYIGNSLIFSPLVLQTPVVISVSITATRDLFRGEVIIVKLRGFSRQFKKEGYTKGENLNLQLGQLIMSPSINYIGSWTEGTNLGRGFKERNMTNEPFFDSFLSIKILDGLRIPYLDNITFTIYIENGIGAYCGFPGMKKLL
jgi:hypothetical protein